MRDADDVDGRIDAARPDLIFHLAGVALPRRRASAIRRCAYDINALGAVRLLAAVARQRRRGDARSDRPRRRQRDQYGAPRAGEMPLDEDAGAAAADRLRGVARRRRKSPRSQALPRARACASSARGASITRASATASSICCRRSCRARARLGAASQPARSRSATTSVRDYLHVADVVDAHICARGARTCRARSTTSASGTGVSVRDLAADVLLRAGVDRRHFDRPALVRARRHPGARRLAGEAARDTGWTPTQDARRHHRRSAECRDGLTCIAFSSSAPGRSSSARPPSSTIPGRRRRKR